MVGNGGDEAGRRGGLSGAFGIIDDLVEMVKRVGDLKEGLEGQQGSVSEHREIQLPGGRSGVYGFSVRLGIGGEEPIVERFGNVKVTEEGAVVSETREPLVDVFDEGDAIEIVAELPGVAEDGIKIDVEGDVFELSAEGPRQRYAKEILLPAAVDAEGCQKTYENGYLRLRYKKAQVSGSGSGSGSDSGT